MKNNSYLAILFFALLIVTGCEKLEDYQYNPNETSEGDPGLLLTNVEVNAFSSTVSLSAALSCRQMVYTYGTSGAQYYNWTRAGFGMYSELRQVIKMEEEAMKVDDGGNYLAIAKFFKAFYFLELTNTFGDIPFEEALMATEELYTPQYSSQQTVFEGILQLLEESNEMLSVDGGALTGDVIYNGDIAKWKKAVNSFRLRVLITLSKRDGDLGVGARFAAIVNNPAKYPLIESNADNLALPYYNIEGNEYPYFNNNDIKSGGYYLDASFVQLLQDKQDPRLFTFADKKPSAAGLDDSDYDAYGGLDGSAELSTNTQQASAGEASPIDARYYSDAVNEPGIVIGYASTQFNLAEAAARGWISANPVTFYQGGITASMQFYGVDTAAIDAYLAQPNVMYVPQNGIEMIITQKYIASFMNSGFELFYTNRRTGFPEFKTDGGGVFNNEMIPTRWMYPQSEIDYNQDNLNEAIDSQYPEGDNINGVMWLIK